MSCLMSAMDSKMHLRDECEKQMKQRIQLWNAAVKVVPPVSCITSAQPIKLLGLISLVISQECLRNDLLCVEWDVKL